MNIDLSKAAPSSKKKGKKPKGGGGGLGLGLNQRGSGGDTGNKKKKKNVLGGGSSSEDDSDGGDDDRGKPSSDNRAAVNRAIASEQAALRKRALLEAAAQDGGDGENVYDYDGAYDTFKKPDDESEEEKKEAKRRKKDGGPDVEEKKSRYIGDLLEAAERRNRERELIGERKVARDQAEEEATNAEYRGKDTFVTAAYRRKLEERELWQERERQRERNDDANDVTKRKGGALANFYGSLNKNVALGGGGDEAQQGTNDQEGGSGKQSGGDVGLGFLEGFERPDDGKVDAAAGETDEDGAKEDQQEAEKKPSLRQIREKKVAEARIRYFQRHGGGGGIVVGS